jgi:hypothetical protein
MDQNLKKQAKQYFEAYPEENTIFFSTDGQAFLQKNYSDAVNHQNHINPEGKLERITRNEKTYTKEAPGAVIPDASWKKADIVAWISAQGVGVAVDESLKKEELLQVVATVLDGGAAEDDDNQGDEDNQ